MLDFEKIGERIFHQRKHVKNMSQEQFAEAMGWYQSDVSNLEKAKSGSGITDLYKLSLIADYFQIPLEQLIFGEGDGKTNQQNGVATKPGNTKAVVFTGSAAWMKLLEGDGMRTILVSIATFLLPAVTFLLAHPGFNVLIACVLSGISVSAVTYVATNRPKDTGYNARRKKVSVKKEIGIALVCMVAALCLQLIAEYAPWKLVEGMCLLAGMCLSVVAIVVGLRAYYFCLREKVNSQAEG